MLQLSFILSGIDIKVKVIIGLFLTQYRITDSLAHSRKLMHVFSMYYHLYKPNFRTSSSLNDLCVEHAWKLNYKMCISNKRMGTIT